MKKFLLFLLLLVSVDWPAATHAGTAAADGEAGLFTTSQIQSLEQQAEKLNEKIKGRVLIVMTTSNLEEPKDFADNCLRDAAGNDQDGSVLLLDMGRCETYISASGNMIGYLTDSRTDPILDDAHDQITNAACYSAARAYLPRSVTYVEDGVPGGYYRVDEEIGRIIRYKVLATVEIIIAVVLALILSLIFYFMAIPHYQLKSDIYKYPFREKSSIKLTEKTDRLTNPFVMIRRIPKSLPPGGGGGRSTTHSSGGGTFDGDDRSF